MITNGNKLDEHDRQQLVFDMRRIRIECPSFIKYIESSLDETVAMIGSEERTEWLLKHSGAVMDLRKILSDIRNPQDEAGSATQ